MSCNFGKALDSSNSNNWATNHYIQIISCDPEDWRNDAENSAFFTGIYFSLQYIIIIHNITVFTVFLVK